MENAQLMPVIEKTPEQIQDEMTRTREALTGKVAALENQVVGTVQTAADTLTGTVESVKSLLTTAPAAVTDTVKQAADVVGEKMKQVFDVSGHVQNHPWSSVGASALLGGIVGWLISRPHAHPVAPVAPAISPQALAPQPPAPPGVFDDMISMIGQKVREVAEHAIETATSAVHKNVREEVPKLVDAATGRLTAGAA